MSTRALTRNGGTVPKILLMIFLNHGMNGLIAKFENR